MSRLPMLTAKEAVKALERGGFEKVGQKGSHLYPHHAGAASPSPCQCIRATCPGE